MFNIIFIKYRPSETNRSSETNLKVTYLNKCNGSLTICLFPYMKKKMLLKNYTLYCPVLLNSVLF